MEEHEVQKSEHFTSITSSPGFHKPQNKKGEVILNILQL